MVGITKKELEDSIASLEEQREKALRHLHTVEGALQVVRGQFEALLKKEAESAASN